MNKYFKNLLAGVSLCLLGSLALAGERGTSDEAVALVKKAQAYLKANGKDKALAEFSNPQGAFKDRDLYVMVYDKTGTNLAHGANQKLVGKNLIDLKDADGKLIVKGFVDTAFDGAGTRSERVPDLVHIGRRTIVLRAGLAPVPWRRSRRV